MGKRENREWEAMRAQGEAQVCLEAITPPIFVCVDPGLAMQKALEDAKAHDKIQEIQNQMLGTC